jgi:hypothetical protein
MGKEEEEERAPEFDPDIATPWESSGPKRQDAWASPCPSVRIFPELIEV